MTDQPTISAELRVDLCKVWVLGFLDAMRASIPPYVEGDTPLGSEVYPLYDPEHLPPYAGTQPPPAPEHTPPYAQEDPPGTPPAHPPYAPTDEDTIPSDMAPHLVKLAEGCIDNAETHIAALFAENPQTVYETVYRGGRDLYLALAAAHAPIQVNLN